MLHKLIFYISYFSIAKKGNVFSCETNYISNMKRILIILGLFLFSSEIFAFDNFYYQYPPYNTLYKRSTYNPYSNTYYSPYRYRKTNYNNPKRIQRINRIRNLNRIKNNILGWNFGNNNNYGTLTGYSTPINQNTYNQLNEDFWKNTKHPTNCNTDLFSSPSSNGMYYTDGTWFNRNRDVSSKAGVRIIYD